MNNNNTFLAHVAEKIIAISGNNLSETAIVFPNKRAALFMNEQLARISDRPIWSPAYLTISELFKSMSPLAIAEPVKLTCELYKSFVHVTGSNESLDHFYGWGQVMLSDFDDIDKNLVDAHRLFVNLRDWHEMDDLSFLSQSQKDVIAHFFSNFDPDHQTELKRQFLFLWSKLAEVYDDFRQRLRTQGLAYEGMLYRDVVSHEQPELHHASYHFVGFNFLNKTEQELFRQIKKQDRAHFYWDFDKAYIREADSEAAMFIRQHLLNFPNELDSDDELIYDNLNKPKDIIYASASSENIQARYVRTWLEHRAGRTAVVLADERLLQAVVHALPEDTDINITTGYPLQRTQCASLLQQLYALQTNGYDAKNKVYRMSYVLPVLRHPFATLISPAVSEIAKELAQSYHRVISPDRLTKDEGLRLVFTPAAATTLSTMQWLAEVLMRIGRRNVILDGRLRGGERSEGRGLRMKDEGFILDERWKATGGRASLEMEMKDEGLRMKDESNNPSSLIPHPSSENSILEQEALFQCYTLVTRLSQLVTADDLNIEPATLGRLIRQIITTTTIPFHGEPLKGIQVMGVLETRNLDFDHLLILSANEGNLPKGVEQSSLIPYSLRKAHQLTTADSRAAVYAYHFYRLLQRAADVTLCYNNQPTNGTTGEMSRFMLQLLTKREGRIQRLHLQTHQSACGDLPKAVDPSPWLAERLQACQRISPTDINQYLRCQLLFYYKKILGIKEPEPTPDEMPDNRLFGTAFHKAAELAYKEMATSDGLITKAAIEGLLKNKPRIESIVQQAFGDAATGEGIILIHRAAISRYLNNLLQADLQLAPFTIIGLEQPIEATLTFHTPEGTRSIKLRGIIDRLDLVNDNTTLRVVDYKTGRSPKQKIREREGVFSTDAIEQTHSDYYLQAMLYATLVSQQSEPPSPSVHGSTVIPALSFVREAGSPDYDPMLSIGDQPISDISQYAPWFEEQLSQLLGKIFDTGGSFQPTGYPKRCTDCAFRQLCFI